jgi:ubiquinone/menaquinone biosynthesis C-methylase UbiE
MPRHGTAPLPRPSSRKGPDRQSALLQYQRRARTYDLELLLFEPIRRQAIERLALKPGQTVLDLGCGTGLSLEALHQGVGPSGRVIGVEQCPEMLARAQERAQALHGRGIRLVCAPVEDAHLVGHADAALFHFTHDILRRPEALDHVLRHLRPGARIVATGLQWGPAWAVPVNAFVWGAAMRSVSSLQGLDRPWSLLAERVAALDVQPLLLGGVFLAIGSAR